MGAGGLIIKSLALYRAVRSREVASGGGWWNGAKYAECSVSRPLPACLHPLPPIPRRFPFSRTIHHTSNYKEKQLAGYTVPLGRGGDQRSLSERRTTNVRMDSVAFEWFFLGAVVVRASRRWD